MMLLLPAPQSPYKFQMSQSSINPQLGNFSISSARGFELDSFKKSIISRVQIIRDYNTVPKYLTLFKIKCDFGIIIRKADGIKLTNVPMQVERPIARCDCV